MTTRTAGRRDKRARILESAMKIFAEKGFFSATVAQVARAAGVADGTIYLYFKSKDELLFALFDEKMAQLLAEARTETQAGENGLDRLQRVMMLHLRLVEENPELARVLILELRQSSTFLKDYDKAQLAAYLGLLWRLVRQGQDEGTIRRDVSAHTVSRAIFGALDELALGWLLAQRKFSLEKVAEEVVGLFVTGLASPKSALKGVASR